MFRHWMLLLIAVLLLVCAASAMAFRDDFDALDTSQWMVYSNGGNVSTANSKLTLSTNGTNTAFPYVYLQNNPFPTTGDFTMRVGVRFTSLRSYGVGLCATTTAPPNGLNWNGDPNVTWKYWGDTESNSAPGTTYHELEWRYSGNSVQFVLDGISQTPVVCARPTCIWFGNCRSVTAAGTWSSMEIDYVEVTPVPEPCVVLPLVVGGVTILANLRRRH